MLLGQFNPKEVACIVAGSILEGFMDGTFITLERNEDSANMLVGAQGDATRTLSNNKGGRMTLNLQQTSPSNAVLNAQLGDMERTGGGIFTFILKDNSGLDVANSATMWVVKPPNMEYANETSGREWILETNNLEMSPLGSVA